MGKEDIRPSWVNLHSQVEPVREFYRQEMQKHPELFEEVMGALWEKMKGGRGGDKHFIAPNPEYPFEDPYLDIACSGTQGWQGMELFIREDNINMYLNRGRLSFICLKKSWDREAEAYRYDYAKRILRFDLSKLAETALTVVEQYPPEERRWVQEAVGPDDVVKDGIVDVEKSLRWLLEQVASWKPVEITPQKEGEPVAANDPESPK